MKVGQKVVCVKSCAPKFEHRGELLPVVGEIYTVRDIIDCGDGIGLLLKEIVNKPNTYRSSRSNGSIVFAECLFNAKNFRPIQYEFGEQVSEYITKEVEKETITV
jgi:hypothetical protein